MARRTDSVEKESIRSDTITFRIDHRIINSLRGESKENGESLNILIGQLLKTYVDYHKPAGKAGNIYFPKGLISRLFDYLPDEQIDKFASNWVNFDPKEQMNVFRQEYTLSIYMTTLCDWLKVSHFPFSQNRTNLDETITIRFDMGRKFSAFFGRCMELICRQFNVINPKLEVTNNTVMFTIPS